MSSNLNRAANTRTLWIPATAGTYYPTAVQLGTRVAAGTLKVFGDTVTTTQANSYFRDADQAATVANFKKGALIREIWVITAGAASTITIEGHNGTSLYPALSGVTAGLILDLRDAGDELAGGFRVTTASATAPLVALVYELTGRR